MSAIGLALAVLIGVSLGFFGGGGSILTVPLLVYVFGLEPKEAIASSLVVVGVASVSGTVQHWLAGNVRPGAGLLFGVASMAGAYAAGRASGHVDGGLLLLLFAAMMLLTSVAMWRGRREVGEGASRALRSPPKLLAQGLAVGSFTGLVGAGGGFLIVPALALWGGLPMSAAVGTSLFVIVLTTASGFLGTRSHVGVDPALVAGVATAAVIGTFVGSRLTSLIDPRAMRRAFAGFVMLMGAAILVREGSLVVRTLAPALPTSWPQLAFAAVMLGLGVVAGRASHRAEQIRETLDLTDGAGI